MQVILEFKSAEPQDADRIRLLVREAYARWVPIIGREPRPMIADYGRAVLEHRIDLLHAGPTLVGLIETVPKDDHLWIENVAVAPEEQGKGYGTRLLAHAETIARQCGRSELRLLTNAAFETNVALYTRTGYVVTATEPFMGGTTVHMRKTLDG